MSKAKSTHSTFQSLEEEQTEQQVGKDGEVERDGGVDDGEPQQPERRHARRRHTMPQSRSPHAAKSSNVSAPVSPVHLSDERKQAAPVRRCGLPNRARPARHECRGRATSTRRSMPRSALRSGRTSPNRPMACQLATTKKRCHRRRLRPCRAAQQPVDAGIPPRATVQAVTSQGEGASAHPGIEQTTERQSPFEDRAACVVHVLPSQDGVATSACSLSAARRAVRQADRLWLRRRGVGRGTQQPGAQNDVGKEPAPSTHRLPR